MKAALGLATLISSLVGCVGIIDDDTPSTDDPSSSAVPATGTQLGVFQGQYERLGATPEAVADALSKFDIVALSHVKALDGSSWSNPSDCTDTGYPYMRELIASLRAKKPGIQIYGYVSGAADSPLCGNQLDATASDCPAGFCANVVAWVNDWLAIEDANVKIDGIFFDYVAPNKLTAATRDNIFSYAKLANKSIMVNIMFSGLNLDFAAQSPYFGAPGDYALSEAFHIGDGQTGLYGINMPQAGADTAATFLKHWNQGKRFNFAALPTEANGSSIDCLSDNAVRAYATFVGYFEPGNVFQYTTSDLGITTGRADACANSDLYNAVISRGIPPVYGTAY